MSDYTLDDARNCATQLIARYAERDAFNLTIRKAFHLEWQQAPTADWIKPTMSPTAHNAAMGAIRLLTATEPQITVPYDQNDETAKAVSDKIEAACKAMWDGSGRIAGRPAHYEMATSAVLFGELCASVSSTAEMVATAEKADIRGSLNRMRAMQRETPYYIKLYDPSKCYPDFDRFGLNRIVMRQTSTWGEVVDRFGKLADEAMPENTKSNAKVTVVDYYDWAYRGTWIEEGTKIIWEEHNLPFIPFIAQVTDGSFLFDYDRPELQRISLLYSLLKSGAWQRENLSLTTIFSLVYAIGSSPLLIRKTNNKGEPLVIDRSVPGGVIDIGMDESLEPFAQQVFDQALMTTLDISKRMANESTIQPQALGAPPQGTMAYSSISLLSQAGRLPLVSHKEIMGRAAAQCLMTALRWYRDDGEKTKFYRRDRSVVNLDPADVPEDITVHVTIEPDLPQDRLQAANVAGMLVDRELASKAWVRENILSIGQTHQMDTDIWTEKRLGIELQRLIEKLKAKDQIEVQGMMAEVQKQQSGENGQTPGSVPTPQAAGGPSGGQAGPVTPGQASGAYPPGGIQPGMPLQGPLPAR